MRLLLRWSKSFVISNDTYSTEVVLTIDIESKRQSNSTLTGVNGLSLAAARGPGSGCEVG